MDDDYTNRIFLGPCLDVLRGLPDACLDAVVTDPPYGLGSKEPTVEQLIAFLRGSDLKTRDFMNKPWDIPPVSVWREVYRVLKPGAHVLSFGGTRTFDLIGLGLRAAGFEFRDTIADIHPALIWCHGMGFPKSVNVSKAIDKAAGAEREVVGTYRVGGNALTPTSEKGGTYVTGAPNSPSGDLEITRAATLEAKRWEGWHTALKPSFEPILVFRKPLVGTIVENVLEYGTGAINVDACRVAFRGDSDKKSAMPGSMPNANDSIGTFKTRDRRSETPEDNQSSNGRWPPNVILTHAAGCQQVGICPVKELDEQSGDKCGASRFFPSFPGQEPVGVPFKYVSKPGKKETQLDGQIINDHVTKKPLELMRWLVRLVCPKGGIVLDPYCGSGTTLHAACEESMRYIGIDNDPHAVEIAQFRMDVVEGREQERQAQVDTFNFAMELDND